MVVLGCLVASQPLVNAHDEVGSKVHWCSRIREVCVCMWELWPGSRQSTFCALHPWYNPNLYSIGIIWLLCCLLGMKISTLVLTRECIEYECVHTEMTHSPVNKRSVSKQRTDTIACGPTDSVCVSSVIGLCSQAFRFKTEDRRNRMWTHLYSYLLSMKDSMLRTGHKLCWCSGWILSLVEA